MTQSLAYIHPDAKIGKNVIIEPFSWISKDVEIGNGTWIGPNVAIFDGARIGKNCKIFPGASISAIPQDLKYHGEKTVAIVGDNTTIRENVTINKGTDENNRTVVGSNCLLMAYVHIAHDCEIGDNCILANSVNLAGHIRANDYAVIGGMCAVQQFVHIGSHSFISGGSLVRKDVPPFVKAAREPLCYIGVNSIGLRRRGFETEKINAIQDIYRILFVKGYNTSKAINIVEAEFPVSDERDEILNFITKSNRGILKSYTSSYENNV